MEKTTFQIGDLVKMVALGNGISNDWAILAYEEGWAFLVVHQDHPQDKYLWGRHVTTGKDYVLHRNCCEAL
jgi:hypothetical protein